MTCNQVFLQKLSGLTPNGDHPVIQRLFARGSIINTFIRFLVGRHLKSGKQDVSISVTKGALYDEPHRGVDGWVAGRTNDDLAGARRTGGGCRRD